MDGGDECRCFCHGCCGDEDIDQMHKIAAALRRVKEPRILFFPFLLVEMLW
jgi:hypothetical protein